MQFRVQALACVPNSSLKAELKLVNDCALSTGLAFLFPLFALARPLSCRTSSYHAQSLPRFLSGRFLSRAAWERESFPVWLWLRPVGIFHVCEAAACEFALARGSRDCHENTAKCVH